MNERAGKLSTSHTSCKGFLLGQLGYEASLLLPLSPEGIEILHVSCLVTGGLSCRTQWRGRAPFFCLPACYIFRCPARTTASTNEKLPKLLRPMMLVYWLRATTRAYCRNVQWSMILLSGMPAFGYSRTSLLYLSSERSRVRQTGTFTPSSTQQPSSSRTSESGVLLMDA
ncbi:hypothetical protein PENSPDRAFT_235988 [Peniophora sp. CONT]|nr:hypothetical protein PENSPDRAFT_235988 [Peniophora sp. CONT]